MAREATRDTSGSDGDHGCSSDGGAVRGEGGSESVSGVTEVGSSGNAAAKGRWGGSRGLLSTLMTEGEEAGDQEEEKASSPVWRLAGRLGWLLLGFLTGAALATTVLFLKHDPETCTVPT